MPARIERAKKLVMMPRPVLVKLMLELESPHCDDGSSNRKALIDGAISSYEKEQLSKLPREVATACTKLFSPKLSVSMHDAVVQAAQEAGNFVREMEKKETTLNTIKATAKRDGCWRSPDTKTSHDYNDRLIRQGSGLISGGAYRSCILLRRPHFDGLKASFNDVFNWPTDLIPGFACDFLDAFDAFSVTLEDTAGHETELQDHLQRVAAETNTCLKSELDSVVSTIRRRAKAHRRALYDAYMSAIKGELKPVYHRAADFKGTGAKRRLLDAWRSAIDLNLFLGVEQHLKDDLTTLVTTIEIEVSLFAASALKSVKDNHGSLYGRLDPESATQQQAMLVRTRKQLEWVHELAEMLSGGAGGGGAGYGAEGSGKAKKWQGKGKEGT